VSGELLAVVYLSPERFAAQPQQGATIEQDWPSFRQWLCSPSFASEKRAAGAWCPAALPNGRVKGGRGPVQLLVADVDEAGPNSVELSAHILEPFEGVVVPTFSATLEKQKHRIVLTLTRPLDPIEEFPLAWAKMARRLGATGITVDRGCKNPNRLYFACVARSREAWLELGGARVLLGAPIDVDRMLDVARRDADAERREREARAREQRPVGHPDAYVRGAIEKARSNLAGAGEGARHEVLMREAWSIARFGLSELAIREAILEAFVVVAGEPRRREGERAIRDAVNARKGAA
jgi:hypothetical protein